MNKFELFGTIKAIYLDSVDIECEGELLEVFVNSFLTTVFLNVGDTIHLTGKITEYGLYATNTSHFCRLAVGE